MDKKYLILECEKKIQRITLNSIISISYDNYSLSITLNDTRVIFYHKSLSTIEKSLDNSFFKINRNSIVNLHYVSEYLKSGRTIILSNNNKLVVSRRLVKEFSLKLKQVK